MIFFDRNTRSLQQEVERLEARVLFLEKEVLGSGIGRRSRIFAKGPARKGESTVLYVSRGTANRFDLTQANYSPKRLLLHPEKVLTSSFMNSRRCDSGYKVRGGRDHLAVPGSHTNYPKLPCELEKNFTSASYCNLKVYMDKM